METNNKKLRQKFFPTELEHAIDVILLKYENDNPKEIELIDSMFEQLRVQKEFKKMVEYNHADEDKESFRIKKIFKNEKYEEELAQLEFSVHLNNGTYDRVLKKLREYLEVMNNKSRIKETLENVTEFEKLESNSNLKKVI